MKKEVLYIVLFIALTVVLTHFTIQLFLWGETFFGVIFAIVTLVEFFSNLPNVLALIRNRPRKNKE